MRLSIKPIKECSPEHKYIFPKRLSNEVNTATGKHCIVLSINSSRRLIPTEEPVELSELEWKYFNSIGGFLPSNQEYDPIRKS